MNAPFTVFKLEELLNLPTYTVMEHLNLGKFIIIYKNGNKMARFRKKNINDAFFYKDGFPWSEPMKILYIPKKSGRVRSKS